jgi:hypothetical protein
VASDEAIDSIINDQTPKPNVEQDTEDYSAANYHKIETSFFCKRKHYGSKKGFRRGSPVTTFNSF